MKNNIPLLLKNHYENNAGQLADFFTDVARYKDIIAPEIVISYCADVLYNPKNETLLLHVLYSLGDVPEIQGFWDNWSIEWGTRAITCCQNYKIIPKIGNYITYSSNPIKYHALWAIYSFLANAILFLNINDNDSFKINLKDYNPKFHFGKQEINQVKEFLPVLGSIKKESRNKKNIAIINNIFNKLLSWEQQNT